MIISSKKNLIFCAFNKTASSSIQAVIGSFGDAREEQRIIDGYRKIDTPVTIKHIRPLHIQQIIGAEAWRGYFTFCFVRNPFARMVSLYHFHRQSRPELFPTAQMSFIEWLRGGGTGTVRRLMTEFVCDDEGRVLVDFIGRYERLAEDYGYVADLLSLPTDLPQIRTSRHGDYRDYYDDESRAIVTQWVQPDLDTFGYRFDPEL